MIGAAFDTPQERSDFVRQIISAIISALVVVYVVKKTKVF